MAVIWFIVSSSELNPKKKDFCAVLLRDEPHMHTHAHEHAHAGLLTPGKEEEEEVEEERTVIMNAMCPWHTQKDSARARARPTVVWKLPYMLEYEARLKESWIGGNPGTPQTESSGTQMSTWGRPLLDAAPAQRVLIVCVVPSLLWTLVS